MELVKRIKTLIQDKENVVIVSGHDHNLQYIEKDNVRQVISGAGSKKESARAVNDEDFSYGGSGYAMLQVYQKGESVVTYYGNDGKEEKLLYRHLITPAKEEVKPKEYGNRFDKYTMASVYDEKMTQHSGFYNFFWGKHYREYYSMKIKARNVTLDTLYGGIKP
ncbi:MAG: metallophosphoesterase, partial [Cytophagaceae bacterium]